MRTMRTRPSNTPAAELRRARMAAGITQEELAERAGVSGRTVSDIERGLRTTVYPDTATRLASALGLTETASREFVDALRGRPHASIAGLPLVPTPLIGREAEVAAVTAQLAHARLVTLTGPGGIGKTRLAIETANRVGGSFADVVLVPLGDLTDPASVPAALAQALGVVEKGERLEALIEHALTVRRTLVLLDTFEHVRDAAPIVASLIARTRESQFLVTSRHPLGIRGEVQLAVPPLALPSDLARRDELLSAAAAALFVDRAYAVQPERSFSEEDARAIAAICRKLSGVPLAIELAAARTKHLPLAALAAQLDRPSTVLTGGPVDLPPRQRTMRDTVLWSYDLLPPPARVVFRRLSAFIGGCELAAAEAVAGEGVTDVLGQLSTLVDHSLLVVTMGWNGPRYDMLDVIADCASEQLVAAGETEAVARRHAHHCLAVAEAAEPELVSTRQREAVERLGLELANLRRAIGWCLAQREATMALRFTVSLWRYWRHTGQLAEGRRWCEATLAVTGEAPDQLLAKAIWGTAFLAFPQGDYARMSELATWDLAVARRGGDTMDLRNALTIVGQVALCEGRYADALAPLAEALEICRGFGVSWQLGTSCMNFGNALLHSGDVEGAEAVYRDGLRAYREIGDATFAAHITLTLAHAAIARGDRAAAEGLARDALRAFVDRGDRIGVAGSLDVLAAVAAAQGDIERAASFDAAGKKAEATVAARAAPFERRLTGELIEAARSTAATERWARAAEYGRAVDLDALLAMALA